MPCAFLLQLMVKKHVSSLVFVISNGTNTSLSYPCCWAKQVQTGAWSRLQFWVHTAAAAAAVYSSHQSHTLLMILQYSTLLWYSPCLLLTPLLFSYCIHENVAAAYLNLLFSAQESVYSLIGSTCSVHTQDIKSHLFTGKHKSCCVIFSKHRLFYCL